uniref:Uncharacterized protein n=1 Tax=Setaria italica TaxID=4555 RepID=K3ZNE2_SETIT
TCCFMDSRQQCKGPASIGVSNLRNQSLDAPIEEALRVEGCDSEMTRSPPPAMIHVEDEEIMSALPNPVNIEDPKLKGLEPLDTVPFRVVPGPYGGKEHIPFDKNKLGHLIDQSIPVKEQSICSFPQLLKPLVSYKEEDWTAFLHTRVDGHKDWYWLDLF